MTAVEYFESARDAALRLRQARDLLANGAPRGGGACGRGAYGDPTAARALADWEAERVAAFCSRAVAEAERRVDALAALAGERRADAVRRHYLGLQTWTEVAAAHGVDRRTAMRWRDEACDLADALGWARVLQGAGFAET